MSQTKRALMATNLVSEFVAIVKRTDLDVLTAAACARVSPGVARNLINGIPPKQPKVVRAISEFVRVNRRAASRQDVRLCG